jgi:hypothetical protein
MLVEEMRDLWICSCGNWVASQLSWCPECCEDRNIQKAEEQGSGEGPHSFNEY